MSAQSPEIERGRGPQLPLRRTLRFRLIVSIALVHALLMGLFVWHALASESTRLEADTEDRAVALSVLLAAATTNAVLTEDLGSLAEVVARVGDHPDVTYAEIIDQRGYVLASTVSEHRGKPARELVPDSAGQGPPALRLMEPIVVAGNTVGQIRLDMSMVRTNKLLAARRNQGLVFILIAIGIGALVASLISLHITRDLHAMTAAANRVGRGDLSVRVKPSTQDEIGHLAAGFNRMVESLDTLSTQARLEHTKRLEAERLAYAGRLAAHMAHEIRNPLSAVINSVKLLDRSDLAPHDRSQLVDIINGETQRLQRILQSFLDSARTQQLQLQCTDVSKLIREVVQLAARDGEVEDRIEINMEFHQLPCVVAHDPDQLRQVFWNLVLNALQAMPQGGELNIRTRTTGNRIGFSITDTGNGFPAQLLSFAKEPFYTGRVDGIGLGLVIVQRILSQHGSQLEIESREGIGTTMYFELNAA